MTTRSKFVEMWDNCHHTVKKIRLTSGDCVLTDYYSTTLNIISLELHNTSFGIFNYENIKGIECD